MGERISDHLLRVSSLEFKFHFKFTSFHITHIHADRQEGGVKSMIGEEVKNYYKHEGYVICNSYAIFNSSVIFYVTLSIIMSIQPKENIKLTEPKPVEPNLPPRYLVSGVSINVKTPEKVQSESSQFLGRIHHKGHRRKSLENYSVSRVNALRNNHMSSFNFKDGTQ